MKKSLKLLLMAGLATALTGCGSNTTLEATPSPKTEGNTTEVTPIPGDSIVYVDPTYNVEMFEETDNEYKIIVDWSQYEVDTKLGEFIASYVYISPMNTPKDIHDAIVNTELYSYFLENNSILKIDELEVFAEKDRYPELFDDSIAYSKFVPSELKESERFSVAIEVAEQLEADMAAKTK